MWKDIIFGIFIGVALACIAITIEYNQLDEIIRPLTHNNDMGGMGVMLMFYIGVLVQPALGIMLGIAIPVVLHKTHERSQTAQVKIVQVTAKVDPMTLPETRKDEQSAPIEINERSTSSKTGE